MENAVVPALAYRPDADRVMRRIAEWFQPNGPRQHLVTVVPAHWNSFNWDLSIDVPTPKPLGDYDFSRTPQIEAFLDFRIRQFERYWGAKQDWSLDDDMMPVFEPRLGWAESAGALVDAEINYYAQTSNLEPVILNYDSFDWNRIGFRAEADGVRILTEMNRIAVDRSRDRFLVMPRGATVNPSDLAKACRGSELFTDFVSEAANVHRLMERCLKACVELIEYVRNIVGRTADGYGVSWNGGYWTPGTILGHYGDNVADLISPAMYREFIIPYTRQMGRHFGGIVFARDASSAHLWPELARLDVVRAFKPRDMGNIRLVPKDIHQIAGDTEGLPLFVEVHREDDFPEFKKAVKDTGVKAFFIVHCSSRDQGKRVIEEVRNLTT